MESLRRTTNSGGSGSPIRLVLLGVCIVVADQIVKLIVVNTMRMGHSIDVIGAVVRFTRTSNTGAAFGLFRGGSAWFVWISAAASLAIILFSREIVKMRFWERTAFGLVLGGAVGNLIDRVRTGAVVDFIDIGFGTLRWPSFNVADSAITIGVIILAIHLVFFSAPQLDISPSPNEESE
ncbi:signal peptidase II [bacterium]|nr:signal peptidase II [bacterium]